MKKFTTITLAAMAAVTVMAASPALAGKKDASSTKQTQKGKHKGIEYQPVIVAGSKNWIQRLYVGRGPGFNGGFVGHPGGSGR